MSRRRPWRQRPGHVQRRRHRRAGDRGYDAVFAFECIHDLPDPVAALAELRRIAKLGAAVVVMDERTADSFDPGVGPVEELLYGYSVLCCLPDGLSHGDSAGTGSHCSIRSSTPSVATWAAASSMASGKPSSRCTRRT